MFQLAHEERDIETFLHLENEYHNIKKDFEVLKTRALLNGKYDSKGSFLTIHTGAGGTESCDWVQMLLRMYVRWCDKRRFKVTELDLQHAEGGVKSVSLQVDGDFAYGYLYAEIGVHRLVRISPFDSSGRRHTTFASVHASPIIDDDIEIEIKQEDIRIDTYRSSGAGGQHVNKTDSAVRVTHIKTGLVVQCQNERSQYKNKNTALKMLTGKLYQFYQIQRKDVQKQQTQEKKDIAWGSQIRSYVFHPYNMVKDHRTGIEMTNVQAVMNGDIDQFINEYLQKRAYS